MSDSQRKRSRNFTEFEKELLLDIVAKHLQTIENKKTDARSIQEKNECWRQVTEEFNARNFNGARAYAQLRMLYDNLKKTARKGSSGERVRSKAAEKLIGMLMTPLSAPPSGRYDFKSNESTFDLDADPLTEELLDPTSTTDSLDDGDLAFKTETDDTEPTSFDVPSSESYDSSVLRTGENKGYKRRLNDILDEIHNFVKTKSDDSHLKKRWYNVRVEQAEIELHIKKVELEIRIKELEIRKKELELMTKEVELKNKQLEKLDD